MDNDCNNNNRVYDGECVKHADLIDQLKVIFPNTSDAVILLTVVAHHHFQVADNAMLESVCDDLLDLRTYRKVDEHYNGSTNVGSDAAEVPGTSGREHRETPDEIDAGAIVEEGVSHPQHARAPVTAALWRPLVEFDEIAAPAEEERDVGGECAVVVEHQVIEAVANDAEEPDVAAAAPAAVARSPPRDPLQVNVDSVMQLFPDAQREHVEALVLAHVNYPDILTTVCNVMVETKYPKVPQVKKYKSRERDGNAQQTVQFDEIAAPAAEERDVGGECAVVVEDQVTEAVANDAEGPDVAAAAVARSPPRDPLQVNVDSVMQLFPDAQREHVEALVLAHVNYPDILTTVCNVMVETKYPKVPQVKKYKNRERDGNAQQTVQFDEIAAPAAEERDVGGECAVVVEAQVTEAVANDAEGPDVAAAAVARSPPRDPLQVNVDSVEFSNYLDESFLKQKTSITYKNEAMNLLKNEFLKVSMADLAVLLLRCRHKYAATRVLVARVLSEREQPTWERGVVWTSEDGSWKKESSLLKGKRKPQSCVPVTDQMLINERNWLRENNSQSKAAMESAVAAGNDEDEDEGEAMECGCCYCEVTFERMVQCSLGHLFCEECLRRYAKEAVYGQGKVALRCMGDGCSAGFPLSQLRKALPRMLMDKYEERQVEESISLAGLADLVRCPNCDFAAILPGDSKVFLCQTVDCMMESCRHCGEDWDEHFGKRCEELEKCDETRLRTHYEERMTKLKVRTCGKCSAQFFKVEGCNKMTCRCGATMCYICRAPKISYQHFCPHTREPGKPCTSCTACSLWTNPDEDEDRAIRELKAEAQETRAAQGFVQDKEFGPPPEVTTHKKQKTA